MPILLLSVIFIFICISIYLIRCIMRADKVNEELEKEITKLNDQVTTKEKQEKELKNKIESIHTMYRSSSDLYKNLVFKIYNDNPYFIEKHLKEYESDDPMYHHEFITSNLKYSQGAHSDISQEVEIRRRQVKTVRVELYTTSVNEPILVASYGKNQFKINLSTDLLMVANREQLEKLIVSRSMYALEQLKPHVRRDLL